jgi:hypothetical protein
LDPVAPPPAAPPCFTPPRLPLAPQEAEANEQRLTPAFLEYVHILALSNNTKVYFGDKLPNMMIEKGARRP